MTLHSFDLSILWPALVAGIIVTASHVPLGMQVLRRGIVFIDLAIAQIAGLGVVAANALGIAEKGVLLQAAALVAALAGALALTWTEKRYSEVQEAIIGVVFVLAASMEVILLASNPHGAEHMKDILVGQILWIDWTSLLVVGSLYAVLLGLWFGLSERLGRIGFYMLFACAVTASVQLVGLYLVFATLIVPALATRRFATGQLWRAYALGIAGYVLGLLASSVSDLPTGPVIVVVMVFLGFLVHALSGRLEIGERKPHMA